MNSTAISKELRAYLPQLEAAPEAWRPVLAHQYAELVRCTEDRLANFMPGTPEQARIKAEMQAAAQYMLNQALIVERPAVERHKPPVGNTSEVWQMVGQFAGQMVGVLVRGAAELVWGILTGILAAIFAPKEKAPSKKLPVEWEPTVCGPISNNNVHVRVDVSVDVKA